MKNDGPPKPAKPATPATPAMPVKKGPPAGSQPPKPEGGAAPPVPHPIPPGPPPPYNPNPQPGPPDPTAPPTGVSPPPVVNPITITFGPNFGNPGVQNPLPGLPQPTPPPQPPTQGWPPLGPQPPTTPITPTSPFPPPTPPDQPPPQLTPPTLQVPPPQPPSLGVPQLTPPDPSLGGDGGGGGCFAAGTLVHGAEGLAPIEALQPGAGVLARSEDEGESAVKRITRRWVHEERRVVRLKLANGEELRTTMAHRFFVEGKGFVAVQHLGAGDRCRTIDGESVAVEAVEPESERATVYNLSVDTFPTYFVGRTGIWVHNVKVAGDPGGEGEGEGDGAGNGAEGEGKDEEA